MNECSIGHAYILSTRSTPSSLVFVSVVDCVITFHVHHPIHTMWKKLPSPGWLAFGTVVTVAGSGIAYDKYEQSQIRSLYVNHVRNEMSSSLSTNVKPRKLLVLVAPPPNDYLDTSLKLWRRWIKPILHSSGLDYEIVSGTKQGEIRTEIASRVRQLRKELIEQEQQQQHDAQSKKSRSWLDWFKWCRGVSTTPDPVSEESPAASFDTRSVLGIFYHNEPQTVVTEDSLLDPSVAGGVICVGRGAYKEYIAGVHEGILGPLEEPPKVVESDASSVTDTTASAVITENPSVKEISVTQPAETAVAAATVGTTMNETGAVNTDSTPAETIPAETTPTENTPIETTPDESSEEKEGPKISKPYILPSDYANASIPAELSKPLIIDPKTGAPAFFEQPLLVVAVPNLSGFTTIPTRIARFYQKRFLCEQVSHSTLAIVEAKSRPFTTTDLDLSAYEELDWPKSWVESGKERGSEWVQPLQGDDRVLQKFRVVEPAIVPSLKLKEDQSKKQEVSPENK